MENDYQLRHVCSSVRLSVCPFIRQFDCLSLKFVRVEQIGCHWKDFYEIVFLSIFGKSVQKI
jgi:hypothetical protein